MPCKPYIVKLGPFITVDSGVWLSAPQTIKGDRKVTLTTAATSGYPGISVESNSGSCFHPTLGDNVSKYKFIGSENYLLILESTTGSGSVTRTVSLIDFTTSPPTEVHILTGNADSPTASLPTVQYSQDTGTAFLIYSVNGSDPDLSEIQNLAIYRSDNGKLLCPGPGPFVPGNIPGGEASVDKVTIYYTPKYGSSTSMPCSLPLGKCSVSPPQLSFPDVVVGGDPSQAKTTDNFTIKNIGNNCLTINSIANVAPFSVDPTTPVLPAVLGPSDPPLTIKVIFDPGSAVGNYGPVTLTVDKTPPIGDCKLVCSGKARQAVRKIGFSTKTLIFPTIPVGDSKTLSLQVINQGDLGFNVTIPGHTATLSEPFEWVAYNGTVEPSHSYLLQIAFKPVSKGPFTETFTITSDIPSNDLITLTGTGCKPEPAIEPDQVHPLDFGQIEKGFRAVKYITVRNPGQGRLTFSARIAGTDASLFGLQPPSGSITDVKPQRDDYFVDPVNPCGSIPVGSGETHVAVAFWANNIPRLVNAELVIENHNASNNTIPSWSYPLKAEIIAATAVDAALILDRSFSMTEMAGERTKSNAVIAGGQLFAQLFRPDNGDRFAVVRFNEIPEVIQYMDEITSANQGSIVGSINSTSLAPAGWTSIAGGIMLGLNEMKKPRTDNPQKINKALVVLTDGNDNRAYQNPADGKWYSILGGEVEKPGGGKVMTDPLPPIPQGMKIYGIGIGRQENIDHGRLDALSSSTGGYFGIVGADLSGKSYFDLEKYFTQVYMNLVDTSSLQDPVYTITPGEIQTIGFDVLRGDVGILVVMYDRDYIRLPFYLKSPTGEQILWDQLPPGFQMRTGFTGTARFVELLMTAGDPARYAGHWTVVVGYSGIISAPTQKETSLKKVDGPVDYGIAIGVGSNFRMQPYVTPGIVHTGEPIVLSAALTEAGLPVTGCNVIVKATSPSGNTWNLNLEDDGNTGNGEYAREFTNTAEAGSYEFYFRAEGKSRDNEPVVREAILAKYVEGRIAIGPDPGGREKPGIGKDSCCARLLLLGKIGIIMLLIIILLLLSGFWRIIALR